MSDFSGPLFNSGPYEGGTGLEPNPTLNPGGGGGDGPKKYLDEPNQCRIGATPEGVELADIHAAAKAATAAISDSTGSRGVEYGVIIYEVDGAIGFTKPVTQHNKDFITWNESVDSLPDNARVLALVHNHPWLTAQDDNAQPSGYDEDVHDDFQNWDLDRGRTVDSNMLTYIVTARDGEDLETYAYNKFDLDDDRDGCKL